VITKVLKIGRGREADILAVPLTPEETGLLVAALREHDRLHQIHFWTHDRADWSVSQAAAVLSRAGAAAALGHQVVPVLVQALHMYDDVVLHGLQQYAPHGQITREFGQLLARMHALSGMARVHGWRVEYGRAGLQWASSPPSPPDHHERRALPQARGGSDAR
jgi:hypothetical protein